ncbi:alpha/beta hydrolase [Alteromonas halophila]|uniref:Serine aminopeptidase S33 domain-containing protein n=1 Tax=Alteromonas halophila TaxID=516698 RepID=A0A918JR24_9ALTE|nr:alpha/beta fold hydrolase [Alteromonas halophila]GGW94308.1 hypothetical protein GCM10007391_30780 [Alteromonas halophila]
MRIFLVVFFMMAGGLSQAQAASQRAALDAFASLYKQEWGQTAPCRETSLTRYRVCSDILRNEGNAPYVLHSNTPADKVAVLVHGLSDSPFFLREIASVMQAQGYTVFVPLLPGHGLRNANDDMSDSQLAERWQAHVRDVMDIATSLGDKVVLGGFSAGAALAVDYYLDAPESVSGLTLFSGALALSDDAEKMARIWGIKWLAWLVDGDYQTHGPNPYKYPSVASYAGLELMDVIEQIRTRLEEGRRISVPVYAAHSADDKTTPIEGVENLLAHSEGPDTFFVIDKSYSLCHADLVVNTYLLNVMRFNDALVNPNEQCAIPAANPLFGQMTMMLESYLSQLSVAPTD